MGLADSLWSYHKLGNLMLKCIYIDHSSWFIGLCLLFINVMFHWYSMEVSTIALPCKNHRPNGICFDLHYVISCSIKALWLWNIHHSVLLVIQLAAGTSLILYFLRIRFWFLFGKLLCKFQLWYLSADNIFSNFKIKSFLVKYFSWVRLKSYYCAG